MRMVCGVLPPLQLVAIHCSAAVPLNPALSLLLLSPLPRPPARRRPRSGTALVFLNGNILGIHRRPLSFVRRLRELRRRGKLGEFVSVYVQVGGRGRGRGR